MSPPATVAGIRVERFSGCIHVERVGRMSAPFDVEIRHSDWRTVS